jgi:hypothetical protein
MTPGAKAILDQTIPMKSKRVAFILCLLFGFLGIHRFYAGKWFTGLLQMFTLGGFGIWWAIDLLIIVCGGFRDASGVVVGQAPHGQSSQSNHPRTNDPSTMPPLVPAEDWIMKAKQTPYWKFLLGANLFKSYQLDFVEKKGDQITVAVQSGKTCTFRIGEFKGKYIKTKEGNRAFTFKSTVGPAQKVTFTETLLQMPEEWWDELEAKLGASESGLSKVFQGAKSLIDFVP